MTTRRTFMKSAASLPLLAVPGCAPPGPAERTSLPPELLRAVAQAVLPGELGEQGREDAVRRFEQWLAGYQPVAERDHGYGTGEITYTGPDPAPMWRAQLEALELEARQRFRRGFAELDVAERDRLVRTQLRRERGALPDAADAAHVATGLLAWWVATPEANDLCHGASISRLGCRPLEQNPNEPAPLARPGV